MDNQGTKFLRRIEERGSREQGMEFFFAIRNWDKNKKRSVQTQGDLWIQWREDEGGLMYLQESNVTITNGAFILLDSSTQPWFPNTLIMYDLHLFN